MTDLELVSRVFVSWNCNSTIKKITYDEKYNSQSFIARILRKKLEVCNIKIGVPDELIMIIELCTEGNPGFSQVMLHEIMKNIPDLKENYVIKPEDFARVYTTKFPLISNPKVSYKFHKLWDDQKDENGNNLCDTINWWKECFE